MQQLRGHVFALNQPSGSVVRACRRFAGARRYVYNRGLALAQKVYADEGKTLRYKQLAAALQEWKADPALAWLKAANAQVLQQALMDLDKAYQRFFEKTSAFPTFKRKGQSETFRFPQGFKLDQANSRLYLPKIGWVRYRNSRPVPGQIKSVTVTERCGKWTVSILTCVDVPKPQHPKGLDSAVGIDRGITRFAALSNGMFVDPLHSFRKHEARLAKYQRAMSRKQKFSRNWKKAKTKVQRIHTQIAHARRDFLHKVSTTLSQNHALIVLEDLKVKNMSRSAKGTLSAPGKNVRAKAGLNKSILDQGWAMFAEALAYKLIQRGGTLLYVPPHYTSQTCPLCHHVSAENRQTQARFCCTACGHAANADTVGAINVLDRGMQVYEGQDTAGAPAGRAPIQEPPAARIACQVNGAARPSATGTPRSDPGGIAA